MTSMPDELDDAELERYSRQVILEEIGEAGQRRLARARVLVIGAGGLGAPLLLYLAAAGVGTIGIVDHDRVDLSNLQRQVIHETGAIGGLKTASAAAAIARINPGVRVECHPVRLGPENAADLIGAYDLVADGSDNFATRYLVNDTCLRLGRPLVTAAVVRFEGQVTVVEPGEGPCWRCIFPEPPPAGATPRCEEAGVLGPIAGVVGTLQATEVLKRLLGLGQGLAGRLLLYDGLGPSFYTVTTQRDPACVGPHGGG